MQRGVPIAACLVALGLAVAASAAAASRPAYGAAARATVVRIAVPGQADPAVTVSGGRVTYPADGSVVSARLVRGRSAHASPAVGLADLSLFRGALTVVRLDISARARVGRLPAASAHLTGLSVDGRRVPAAADRRLALGRFAIVSLLRTARAGGPGRESRFFGTVLDVRLTAAHDGLPAGTEIVVGRVETAAAAAEHVPPPIDPVDGLLVLGPIFAGVPAASPELLVPPGGPRRVRSPLRVTPPLRDGRLVFPVYGLRDFVDTFGAPRPDVGFHHGVDLFARPGTPILAVADGTVFSVGRNDLGGNRLWLRDRRGNEFYYAHLTAYSPFAVDGMQVEAGDVVGYVGRSGDAEGTPPHLHFEVHPASLLGLGYDGAVDATPYLLAARHLRTLRFPALAHHRAGRPTPAPEPGALLVEAATFTGPVTPIGTGGRALAAAERRGAAPARNP